MKAKELEVLIFNPIHTSMVLYYFISGAQSVNSRGIKTELIYLAMPFIYNDFLCLTLSKLNKKSKLNTFMNSSQNQLFISVINDKIKDYKAISKLALIFLGNNSDLSITNFISLKKPIHYSNQENVDLKKISKASYNLGMILGKERYLDVFLKLRITEL